MRRKRSPVRAAAARTSSAGPCFPPSPRRRAPDEKSLASVRVGIMVAHNPLYGSGQAGLPHPALTSPLGPAVKVLMVWPRFPASYWSLEEVTEIVPERSLMPPLGLITVAALCPKQWAIRLVDLAFQELSDEDLLWADLVMVSAMQVQRDDVRRTLERASKLSRRTMIGGPYASSEPEALLPLADHVVVGEPDEVFREIAADLEVGSARRLYRISEKPDVSRIPVPRF